MLARSVVGGVLIGGGAATVYRWSKLGRHDDEQAQAAQEAHFMNDHTTQRQAQLRREQAVALDGLLRRAAPAIQDCRQRANAWCGILGRSACVRDREAASEELTLRLSTLRDEASRVSYGGSTTAEERDAYVAAFGCVAWSEAALDALARRSPLVEVGAGEGQWARVLKESRGADVLAFDDGSALPMAVAVAAADAEAAAAKATHDGVVTLGIDGAAAASKHAERTLVLVAPPPGPEPAKWLAAYEASGGRSLVYVGEGRGGAHADAAFFAALEQRWALEQRISVKPFPGGAEKMWCLRRRATL